MKKFKSTHMVSLHVIFTQFIQIKRSQIKLMRGILEASPPLLPSVLCGKSLPPSLYTWPPQSFVGSPCRPSHALGYISPLREVPAALPTPLVASVLCGKSLPPSPLPWSLSPLWEVPAALPASLVTLGLSPLIVGSPCRPPHAPGYLSPLWEVPTAVGPSRRPWGRPGHVL